MHWSFVYLKKIYFVNEMEGGGGSGQSANPCLGLCIDCDRLSIIYESWLLFFQILSVSFGSEAIYSVGAFSQRMTRDYCYRPTVYTPIWENTKFYSTL